MYEPAGEAQTLAITEDSPEPMIAVFVVEGGLIEAGLHQTKLDALIR